MTVAGKILLIGGDLKENGKIERIISENASYFQIKYYLFEDINLDLIRDFSPDVVLLSVNLTDDLEKQIIRIRTFIKPEIIPLIVISLKKNQDWLKIAFALGAWDFIDFRGDKMEMIIRISSVINISNAFKQKINQKELLSKKTDELAVRNDELESLSQITSKLHYSLIIINSEKTIEWVNEEGYKLYNAEEKLSNDSLLKRICDINRQFESGCKKCMFKQVCSR
jgi:PleD family two-component response regulator